MEDFNSFSHDIKFTYEIDEFDKEAISFLDLKVISFNDKLMTSLYRKPTDWHQYLHYKSSHPRSVATGENMGTMPPSPLHLNFQTKQGPTVSVSNIGNIAFHGYSKTIRTRNFTISTKYAFFGEFTVAFHFF